MKVLLRYSFAVILITSIISCQQSSSNAHENGDQDASAEQQPMEEAYVSLLDEGLSQWRNYKEDTISDKWVFEDGMLVLKGKNAGDIITKNQYENFELALEWRISEGGNSGIFFHVLEADSLGRTFHTGPEMQVLDNERHKDAKIHMHRAGDNYDMHACAEETVNPAMEWNEVKLIVNNKKVTHWLNGTKVVEYVLQSPDWEERYQKSKFTKWPMYGRAGKGHIALQDHGDLVWFRNIRIKEL